MRFIFAALSCMLLMPYAAAQEAGWSYSYVRGEGDRASAGCANGSTPQDYGCLIVRCDDDFSVAVYLDSSRAEGDVGIWHITIDKLEFPFEVVAADTPYGGRVSGDMDWLLDGLKQGATAYIRPDVGDGLPHSFIPLNGSLMAINEALYFCAPRVLVEDEVESASDTSQ